MTGKLETTYTYWHISFVCNTQGYKGKGNAHIRLESPHYINKEAADLAFSTFDTKLLSRENLVVMYVRETTAEEYASNDN